MGKKQSRQNRSSSGGQQHGSAAETHEPAQRPPAEEQVQPTSGHVSRKQQPKFGHN